MKIYFDSINLLRAFAAISVLVYHVIELFSWQTFPVNGPLVWFRIGVLFFTIMLSVFSWRFVEKPLIRRFH